MDTRAVAESWWTPAQVRAMNHVIDKGQVLYWGTSEWTAQVRLDLTQPFSLSFEWPSSEGFV